MYGKKKFEMKVKTRQMAKSLHVHQPTFFSPQPIQTKVERSSLLQNMVEKPPLHSIVISPHRSIIVKASMVKDPFKPIPFSLLQQKKPLVQPMLINSFKASIVKDSFKANIVKDSFIASMVKNPFKPSFQRKELTKSMVQKQFIKESEDVEDEDEEEGDSKAGSAWISQAISGSFQQLERLKDVKEAKNTVQWLMQKHPAWYKQLTATAIFDKTMSSEVLIEDLSYRGCTLTANGRRAVTRYYAFVQPYAVHIDDRKVPTQTEMIIFLRRVNIEARQKAENKGQEYRGTAALSIYKGLDSAHRMFGAPFPPSLMRIERVKLAAYHHTGGPSKPAHMSIAVVMFMEEAAMGEYSHLVFGRNRYNLSPIALTFIRIWVIAYRIGWRSIELIRASVKRISNGRYMMVSSNGGKQKSKLQEEPTCAFIPDGPFKGSSDWLNNFLKERVNSPSFISQYKGRLLINATWINDQPISAAKLRQSFYDILKLPPLALNEEMVKRASLTPYSSRHLLPEVAQVAMMPESKTRHLGQWQAMKQRYKSVKNQTLIGMREA
jgi:hypothetical protein